MVYQFLTEEDITQQIKEDLLLDIIDVASKDRKIKKAEAAALKQIRGKLGDWFNMDLVLISAAQWNNTENYTSGKVAYDEGIVYTAITDNVDKKPKDNNNDWTDKDPRDGLLVMYCADITLYHLHSSVNPRKIPELRKERYKEAIDWLDMIADRTVSTDFPIVESEEEDELFWGSNPKIEHYY